MASIPDRIRRTVATPLGATCCCVALVYLATACGGGSPGAVVPSGPTAAFVATGSAVAPDFVRLSGSSDGNLATVIVVIDGPTTSDDLYSFAFDLLLGDPSVVRYVTGSAQIGAALSPGSGQTNEVLAVQNGDRVSVGVTKIGGGPGNGIPAGEREIVSLVFQVQQTGVSTLTIVGSPPNDPAALDSSGALLSSVTFDSADATIAGN